MLVLAKEGRLIGCVWSSPQQRYNMQVRLTSRRRLTPAEHSPCGRDPAHSLGSPTPHIPTLAVLSVSRPPQEHLGFLGSRPVHEYDPAFHPHEAKRVGFHARGMISPPPRPPLCPTAPAAGAAPGAPPWPPDEGGDGEAGEALVLKGGIDASGEGSYRLKRRFEGGSHGEVRRR